MYTWMYQVFVYSKDMQKELYILPQMLKQCGLYRQMYHIYRVVLFVFKRKAEVKADFQSSAEISLCIGHWLSENTATKYEGGGTAKI